MAHVRISSGAFKGRALGGKKVFSSRAGADPLRPTAAKVRAALFNILQFMVPGRVFVDLFAGTGAVGIEALSRGASKVIFVESIRARAKAIADFLEINGLSDKAEVFHGTAESFLKRPSSANRFDIVFVDPPYDSDDLEKTLSFFDRMAQGLSEEFCLMAEHPSKKLLPAALEHITVRKQYKYGDTMLTWYVRKTA